MRFTHYFLAFSTLIALPTAMASVLPYESRTALLLQAAPENFVGLKPYEQNYLMETYSNRNFNYPENMKHDEVKFQISVAVPLWKGILGKNSVLAGAYTQRSWFQLSNRDQSSPFRESNYQPQLFLAWATNYDLWWGWKLADIETGFVHLSNGRSDQQEKSRSWNRLYLRASFTKDNWLVELKPYWRIPEKAASDDNPDIVDYYGYGDLSVGYRFGDHIVKTTARYNTASNKGGMELSWSYPIAKYVRLYAQYYHGYGESLIDYNRSIDRIGLGISLNNVF